MSIACAILLRCSLLLGVAFFSLFEAKLCAETPVIYGIVRPELIYYQTINQSLDNFYKPNNGSVLSTGLFNTYYKLGFSYSKQVDIWNIKLHYEVGGDTYQNAAVVFANTPSPTSTAAYITFDSSYFGVKLGNDSYLGVPVDYGGFETVNNVGNSIVNAGDFSTSMGAISLYTRNLEPLMVRLGGGGQFTQSNVNGGVQTNSTYELGILATTAFGAGNTRFGLLATKQLKSCETTADSNCFPSYATPPGQYDWWVSPPYNRTNSLNTTKIELAFSHNFQQQFFPVNVWAAVLKNTEYYNNRSDGNSYFIYSLGASAVVLEKFNLGLDWEQATYQKATPWPDLPNGVANSNAVADSIKILWLNWRFNPELKYFFTYSDYKYVGTQKQVYEVNGIITGLVCYF